MASSQSDVPPWARSRGNKLGDRIVNRSMYHKNLLEGHRSTLVDCVQLADLWKYLREFEVICAITEDRLKHNAIEEEQVEKLLDYLLKQPTWRLNAFFRALYLSGQEHILEEIGAKTEKYRDKLDDTVEETCHGGKNISKGENTTDTLHDKSPQKGAVTNIEEIMKVVKYHSEYYELNLMQGRLFDLEERDTYDMKKFFIQITAVIDPKFPVKISTEKILSEFDGNPKPRVAVLTGQPGAGKTTFVNEYTHSWSKALRMGDSSQWKVIIIVPLSTVKGEIEDVIKQSLYCKESLKNIIVDYVLNDGSDALLIFEALDECRDPAMVQRLQNFVEKVSREGGPTILVTSRSGLCAIDLKLFNRQLKIDGFLPAQGIEYIECFFSKTNDSSGPSILHLIKANMDKFNHILTNPLRVHILCVALLEGVLDLEQNESISEARLLECLEEVMRKRQLEKNQKATPGQSIDVEVAAKNVYNMALFCLLTDKREFDSEMLAKFDIQEDNPYLTFMKSQKDNFTGQQLRNFTHEVFFEYFSACALANMEDDLLGFYLLVVCSKKHMRNTQRLLFGKLKDDPDKFGKLVDMIRGTMVLQGITDEKNFIASIQSGTSHLLVEDMLSVHLLESESQRSQQLTKVAAFTSKRWWKKIHACFEETTGTHLDWSLLHSVHYDDTLLPYLYDCLHEVTESQQQRVFRESFGCVLPAMCDTYRIEDMLFANDDSRWTTILIKDDTIQFISISPKDTLNAIQQYRQLCIPSPLKGHQKDIIERDEQHMGRTRRKLSRRTEDFPSLYNRHVKCIRLSTPTNYGTLLVNGPHPFWKVPPDEHFISPQIWLDLLDEIGLMLKIKTDELFLCSTNQTILGTTRFLDLLLREDIQKCLKKVLVKQEGGWRDVSILVPAVVDCSCLSEWISLYKKQNIVRVRIGLVLNYVAPHEWKLLSSDLKVIKHGGQHLFNYAKLGVADMMNMQVVARPIIPANISTSGMEMIAATDGIPLETFPANV